MIHTSITQNCTVFILLCELTRSAIYGSQSFDSHNMADRVCRRGKTKTFNLLKVAFTHSLYTLHFTVCTICAASPCLYVFKNREKVLPHCERIIINNNNNLGG